MKELKNHIRKTKKFLTIGQINSPYGILGWMKFYSFTEKKIQTFNYSPWYFLHNNKYKLIYLKNWKKYKNIFLIQIKKIEDRTTAKKFNQQKIFIKSKTLPILENNNYYWKDIIGCNILNHDNQFIGKVSNIIATSSNDILVIKNKTYNKLNKEILVPFILNKTILNVDIVKNTIQVAWNNIVNR